jgi:hypothetical protein
VECEHSVIALLFLPTHLSYFTAYNVWCLSWGGAVGRIPTGAMASFHRRAQYYLEWDTPWKNDSEEKQAIAWIERFREALQPYVLGSYVNVPDHSIND